MASPVLNKPHTLDTSAIDSARASEVEAIVHDARFFELPAHINTTQPGAADYFTYTITVKEEDRTHSIVLTDPISDDGITRLIEILKSSS